MRARDAVAASHTFLLPALLFLSLLDIQARITGPKELYIRKGSTISLTCIIELQDLPMSNVTWYHAGAVIDFNGPRYEESRRVEGAGGERLSSAVHN